MTREQIQYTEPLTGTLAEAAEADPLGVPFSPLAQTWQVNPGTETAEPGGEPGEPVRTTN
ncbi:MULTISPECIES: hypothetical protein [Bacillales]|uniref:Lasso RiPP family leader peptide-containing protein n=1 Tax=Brevibacillus aydinogluensis TaxID=927786 RepID=A0AA48M836_9BACL|nr:MULTISPECIES: hypothetical protein [Bacillales]REK63719.1 MAG: hypothetical protein DF221_09360 [Brevibacillus sp.]MBR8660493.1 hypothetical protein [Brevibacillus sp. NL20B1]MDT3415811.1 pSer/pThr/pTyr-binding forkhead associated (FHA) protein [Brevibacillus aydinogluensis]NNV03887.1 hypothetical protein [Brevibacillus sp. MCWH]UFJ61731.1 hypothetical protein IRT44_02415 [Anoxybacillus sediminis]